MTSLERHELIGAHPQPVRYYLVLAAGTFRTALDVAMLVAGTALVGLAAALLLSGLEIVDGNVGLGLGAALGSSLVIGLCGGFALGVASEGRYGSDRRLDRFPSIEVAIGRAVAIALMSIVLGWAAGRLGPMVADLPSPFAVAVEVVRTVAVTGFIAAIVGVTLAWGVRRGLDRLGWGLSLEIPTLYLTWLVLAIATFHIPG